MHRSVQIQDIFYNTRKTFHSSDGLRNMEDMYLNTKGSSCSLMQFNIAYADEKGAQRLIGFGRPEAFNKLKSRDSQVHVDATFSCCPKAFYQCLIISVYLEELNLFLPCFYVLMTRKSQLAYELALSNISTLLGGKLRPKWVMHDFEVALCNALSKLFKGTTSLGCYFHFIQALVKKMIEHGIPKDMAYREVKWFELMTICPRDEIFTKCLDYISYNITLKEMNETEDGAVLTAWANFFNYVRRQWDTPLMISLFNYDGHAMEM